MPLKKRGLEGVVAAETTLSVIDGKKGTLKYRGISISDLASKSDFEEVTYFLWFGKLPTKTQLAKFKKDLRSSRKIDSSLIPIIKKGIKNTTAMDALRTSVSYLAQLDRDHNKHDPKAHIRKAIRLTAKFPTIVAAYWRLRQNKKPIQPKSNLSHGANFLYMLTGKIPSQEQARAIELDFLLTAEHGMNASTFTTRVAAATLTDYHSAITAGICTLKGPLHGAAREKVYGMLVSIGAPKKAAPTIKSMVKKHELIWGFGHRVYKAYDPRAKIFKATAERLGKESKNPRWAAISNEIEKTVTQELVIKKGKQIFPNVDFFTAAVYKYLSIPKELTTGIFAIGRIAGWSAHFFEQNQNNRLIRPASKYMGPKSAKYIPIEKRK